MLSFLKLQSYHILIGLTVLLLMACQGRGGYQAQELSVSSHPNNTLKRSSMNQDAIQVKLTAEPLQFSLSNRKDFRISIAATNQGNATLDPDLHHAQLFVNNQESTDWNLAIGNGRRVDQWYALPPGETVSMTWSSLGEALFPTVGQYTLVLHYGNKQLNPIQVQVLP